MRPTFTLSGGLVLSGRWDKIEGDKWQVETPWGQKVQLPTAEIRGVRFRGGQMAYLSDLKPSKVEETPYFGRRTPYRRDVALDGSPLKLDDQPIEKGLAVHSRTALTYDLTPIRHVRGAGRIRCAGNKKGRVDCRVFADGKELYANPDLRADAPPVAVPARLGRRTAPADRGLRARRGHRGSRDLGERPAPSIRPRGGAGDDLGGCRAPGPIADNPNREPTMTRSSHASHAGIRLIFLVVGLCFAPPSSGPPRTVHSSRSRSTSGRSGSAARPRIP